MNKSNQQRADKVLALTIIQAAKAAFFIEGIC